MFYHTIDHVFSLHSEETLSAPKQHDPFGVFRDIRVQYVSVVREFPSHTEQNTALVFAAEV